MAIPVISPRGNGVRRAAGGEGGGVDQMGGVDEGAVEQHSDRRCPSSSDSWPDPMLDPDIQRQLPSLADRIRKNFDESDWIAMGAMTGCLDQIEGHHRLLRSLSFRDPDYRGHVIVVLSRIVENDRQNLKIISDYLAQQYPSTQGGINVSSRPVPGRAIYFTPSVFEVPEQSVDQMLVAVMMPFAAEYREVYETIQRAGTFHGLTCNRVDDIWENAILIQDIFSLIYRSYIVVCDFSGRNPNVFYETGIAHTLGKHVIPITQSQHDVPFDLTHHRYILYHNNGEGRAKLQQQLQRRFGSLFEL